MAAAVLTCSPARQAVSRRGGGKVPGGRLTRGARGARRPIATAPCSVEDAQGWALCTGEWPRAHGHWGTGGRSVLGLVERRSRSVPGPYAVKRVPALHRRQALAQRRQGAALGRRGDRDFGAALEADMSTGAQGPWQHGAPEDQAGEELFPSRHSELRDTVGRIRDEEEDESSGLAEGSGEV
ncbi:hypothetical protein NDU88_005644 [Pleurodeles waltl]|uniref:Uncharacterized protein n=1 Tax=Pleurodeles waltl TaxID=8319 RepID=A0AAV7NQZ4_PLEWA|nr:hypothetical protein NDU88_005644 [Pleurodeles waltl]